MIDPVRQRQLAELEEVEIGHGILINARNELYLNFRYLDVALSSFVFEADRSGNVLSTDGFIIYYQPDLLFSMYKGSRIRVNRAYLHMLFHCLFCHLSGKGNRDKVLWDVACDITIESILDSFYVKSVYQHQSAYRREIYGKITAKRNVFTAEGIYKDLTEMNLTQEQLVRMAGEFFVDSHERWDEEEDPKVTTQRQNQWQEMREKMETEMESFGEENAPSGKDLLEQIKSENRERYDYKRFLKKFSVLREEAEVDPDSFDPIFYTYGMTLYKNMPLIEPLETREVFKIEDFVIAIDTSMSVSGDLMKRFLEETYGVLSESESYFRKVNIHIIQCDEEIRSDVTITSQEEMKDYMEHFTLSGFGGTDFRPAFEYVNGLLNKGAFKKLRGLLYFTDGKGIYPISMPPYDTAFVFMEGQYEDISVPGWAMKVILTEEDLNLS
jgi:predicted metal-dependent peptidase